MNSRSGTVWAGLGLIGLGIAFLAAMAFGWDRFWPVFPLLGGLAFLAAFVGSGLKDSGFVWIGVAATLVGLFFFGFTLGVWEWEEMRELWPIFPLIAGVAFIALFLAERARDWGTLGVGLAGIIVGIVGLAYTKGGLESDIWKYWPALIILVGVLSLLRGLFQRGRK
ncbi:MAG: hypothetical protein JXM73_05680 [Anaerolineae bacterium]|nr:hypothetical protein [Anaerolineae bacterium]